MIPVIFNRAARRKLYSLSLHTRPVEGKPGKIEPKPREADAFRIQPSSHPRKVQRWMRRTA